MTPYSLTLNFATVAELEATVARLATTAIAPADRPDVGAEIKPTQEIIAPPVPPVNPFLKGPPTGAPFGVGAAVPPTAPAGAPATSPLPATVFAPPASIAPAAAAPTVPAAPTTPALDGQGLPWDGRIHASTKTFNKDGTWRQKRELDPAAKLAVETELRQAMAARAPSTVPAASAAPAVPVPPVPTAPPPAAPVAPTGETFGQLMARLGPIFTTGDARVAKINETLAVFGLSSLAGLAARADLVAPFAAMVDAALATA